MSRKKTSTKNISFDDERKVYYVTFNYGKNQDGKNVKTTKTYTNLAIAKKELKSFEANKIKHELILPNEDTLRGYLQYWMHDVKGLKCEHSTLYGYQLMIDKYINPNLGKTRLQDITTIQLNKYFAKMIKNGLSTNTVRKHYDLLKDALKQAKMDDKIYQNPLEQIEPIKIKRKEQNCYTQEELQNLFDIIKGQNIEIAIKLAGMLGLRREEISGLIWENVDFDNNLIKIVEARVTYGKVTEVKDTKNRHSYRVLFLPEELKELLLTIRRKQKKYMKLQKLDESDFPYVFCKEDGQPYRPNYISNRFKTILDRNSLPHIRFHDLRHSFASIANDLGVSLYDISKALGHGDISTTTKIYTHMFDKTNKKAIATVANQFKENK